MAALTDSFEIGGIGSPTGSCSRRWRDRQLVRAPAAKRHGAGLAVSEMVSSFALHYRNERTLREPMRIHPGRAPRLDSALRHDAE